MFQRCFEVLNGRADTFMGQSFGKGRFRMLRNQFAKLLTVHVQTKPVLSLLEKMLASSLRKTAVSYSEIGVSRGKLQLSKLDDKALKI